jgi:two-component system cell cycle sensor histidine kinase/response regulator CckA
VRSEPGHGTTFKVYLPRELSAKETCARPRLTTGAAGAETILVVEDEDAVRNLAKRILERAGYTVLTAANGGEALGICRRRQGIRAPRADRRRHARDERQGAGRSSWPCLHPNLRVLYMSGYTDDAIVHRGVLAPGTHFIGKPFNARRSHRMVRKVLDEALPDR